MTEKNTAAPKETGKKKRRVKKVLLRIFGFLIALAVIAAAVIAYSAAYSKTHYRISFYQETSEKVSGNIRVAVISDIHNREYGENNETLLSDLRSLEPDLILFPGDMVIRDKDDYQAVLDLVSGSAQIARCYGVLGKHECGRRYCGNVKGRV